jgi:hypothetical protein
VHVPGIIIEIDGEMRYVDIDIDIDTHARTVDIVYVSLKESRDANVVHRAMWGGNRIVNLKSISANQL